MSNWKSPLEEAFQIPSSCSGKIAKNSFFAAAENLKSLSTDCFILTTLNFVHGYQIENSCYLQFVQYLHQDVLKVFIVRAKVLSHNFSKIAAIVSTIFFIYNSLYTTIHFILMPVILYQYRYLLCLNCFIVTTANCAGLFCVWIVTVIHAFVFECRVSDLHQLPTQNSLLL